MVKPTKHRGKWRIRWTVHGGRRQSEVHDCDQDAELALCRHQLEALEIKRGERSAMVRGKTVGVLCDYWLESRATRFTSPVSQSEEHQGPDAGPHGSRGAQTAPGKRGRASCCSAKAQRWALVRSPLHLCPRRPRSQGRARVL